jgi:hypothetical protein
MSVISSSAPLARDAPITSSGRLALAETTKRASVDSAAGADLV